ncbi:MAG: amidohydrolase family protein [Pseudomonadota bacterium]|nr:amidohydrolase family protein [Pseudomonadota bacterium]
MLLLLAACVATGPGTKDPSGTDSRSPGDSGVSHGDLPAGAWVIEGVTVVDADGARADRAVIVADGRIFDVRAAGALWPDDVEVREGGGRWLVPGLVDAHVHLGYAGAVGLVGDTLGANLAGQLYWGVTQVVDVGGPTVLFSLRDRVEAGDVRGPRVLATGPMLTTVGSHPCEDAPAPDQCVFVTPDDAEDAAETLVASGADALKVALADASFTRWPTPRLEVEAVRAAAAAGLPVYAHVDEDDDVVDAIAAGVTILAHPPFAGPMGADALLATTEAAALHTTVSAFAGVGDLLAGVTDPDDPDLLLTDAVRADWRAVQDGDTSLLEGWPEASEGWADHARANLSAAHAAGATILPGSDAGYYFVPHGAGLHQELAELEALGWSPLDALAAATSGARTVLGIEGGWVRTGEPADLVLLTEDPTASVAALAAIEAVIVRGVAHERADLRTFAAGAFDDVCLSDDCPTGQRCDGVTHTCATACDTPYDVHEPACGEAAWCMPEDGASAVVGVCHTEEGCDLYAQDCAPVWYGEACVPFDHDTSACMRAGPRDVGERCSWTDPSAACEAGLFCSWVDARCYELCDPAAGDTCTTPSECIQQRAAPEVGWFGLCL